MGTGNVNGSKDEFQFRPIYLDFGNKMITNGLIDVSKIKYLILTFNQLNC